MTPTMFAVWCQKTFNLMRDVCHTQTSVVYHFGKKYIIVKSPDCVVVIYNVKAEKMRDLSVLLLSSVWFLCWFSFEKKQDGRTNFGFVQINMLGLKLLCGCTLCSDGTERCWVLGDLALLFLKLEGVFVIVSLVLKTGLLCIRKHRSLPLDPVIPLDTMIW